MGSTDWKTSSDNHYISLNKKHYFCGTLAKNHPRNRDLQGAKRISNSNLFTNDEPKRSISKMIVCVEVEWKMKILMIIKLSVVVPPNERLLIGIQKGMERGKRYSIGYTSSLNSWNRKILMLLTKSRYLLSWNSMINLYSGNLVGNSCYFFSKKLLNFPRTIDSKSNIIYLVQQ